MQHTSRDEDLIREVPTHLFQFQEKILFWTVPQLLYDTVASVGLWYLWSSALPLVARVALATCYALAVILIVHVPVGGRPFLDWLFLHLRYLSLPKRAVWSKNAAAPGQNARGAAEALPATQTTWVPLTELARGALGFAPHTRTRAKGKKAATERYAAVIEVERGFNWLMLAPDEWRRIMASFESLVDGAGALSTYSSNEPIDADTHPQVVALARQVNALAAWPELAALAREEHHFLREELASCVTTRHFVIVSASLNELALSRADGKPPSIWKVALSFRWMRRRADQQAASLLQQLRTRTQVVLDGLRDMGLPAQVLDDPRRLHFYGSCLAPGSRLLPFGQIEEELDTAPGGMGSPSHRGAAAPSQHAAATSTPQSGDERLFEEGTRSLQDLVAPHALEVFKDHLFIERDGIGRFLRLYAAIKFPHRLPVGWIAYLLARQRLPMFFVFHWTPFENNTIRPLLEASLTQIESNRLGSEIGRRIEKAGTDIGAKHTKEALYGLELGTSHLFSVSLTFGVHASSKERLDERSKQLLAYLRQLGFTMHGCSMLQDAAYQTTTLMGVDALHMPSNMPTPSLAANLPFMSTQVGTGDGVYMGMTANREPVFVHPWSKRHKLANANISIFGQSGRGKSYCLKRLGMGALSLMNNVDLVVLDKDDDWLPICLEYPGISQRIDLSQSCPLNPLRLPFTADDVARLVDDHSDLFLEFIDHHGVPFLCLLVTDGMAAAAQEEETLLRRALLTCFARAGITSEAIRRDPEGTLSRPAPGFADLVDALATLQEGQAGMPRELAGRLERYLHYFRSEDEISLARRITVFSIKDTDERRYSLAMAIVRNYLQRNRAELRYQRFVLFLVDEASFILRHPIGRKVLEQAVRSTRKQGISMVTSSQHPTDFLEYGQIVLDNSAACLLFGMPESAVDQLHPSPQLKQFLTKAPAGHCALRIDNEYATFVVRASAREHRLYTTDPDELMAQAREAQRAAVGKSA